MNYTFPVINHIDDVLPHINDSKEFHVVKKDRHTVINYRVLSNDTFPNIIDENDYKNKVRRECRGIVFDQHGNLLSRGFQKFFNVNEREETSIHNININTAHIILEKLDGSMIRPIWIVDHFRWITKSGITDISMMAEEFVLTRKNYSNFAKHCYDQDLTPIFEFCSRKNKVIIDHPIDRLVLLAIRHNKNGNYVPYAKIKEHAKDFNIEVVTQYPGTVSSMQHLVDTTRQETQGEGWCVHFENGHIIKIKTETYIRLHKVMGQIALEKNLVNVIINEEIDDLKSFINGEFLDKVNAYEKIFWDSIDKFVDKCNDTFNDIKFETRKDFAFTIKDYNAIIKTVLFKILDNKDTRKTVLEMLQNYTSNQNKFNQFKQIVFPNCKWHKTTNE